MDDFSGARYANAPLRRAAARLLAHEAGGTPETSNSLAAASGRLLEKLAQRLGQVVGPAGVKAIFLRAVRLRKSEFIFLDERILPGDNRESLAEALRACLQKQEPEAIREVSVALFATFTGLLANVIGDRLTWRLLQQIWPDTLGAPDDSQETDE